VAKRAICTASNGADWLNLLGKEEQELMKNYKAPSLVVYGTLMDITLGAGGSSPDVVSLNNNVCLTGTSVDIFGATVTIGCTTGPSGAT
jgi:hypothetical protein